MRKIIFIAISSLFLGCVTQEKYNELVTVNNYLEEGNKKLNELEKENKNLLAKNRQQRINLEKTEQTLTELQSSFQSLNRNYQDLAARYDKLISSNRQISLGSATNKQEWEERLARLEVALETKERELQTLRFSLEQKEKRLQELLQLLRERNN